MRVVKSTDGAYRFSKMEFMLVNGRVTSKAEKVGSFLTILTLIKRVISMLVNGRITIAKDKELRGV